MTIHQPSALHRQLNLLGGNVLTALAVATLTAAGAVLNKVTPNSQGSSHAD